MPSLVGSEMCIRDSARTAYSRTTASRFAQSFRRRFTTFLAFGKLPPAPTTQTVMAGRSVRITRRPKWWQWWLPSSKLTGMCSSPTSNLHTTIRSRCHRFSSQRGPYGQASAPPSHAIRAQRLLQEIPPVPRHSRPPLDSSSTTRSGEEHETPIGSRSRWRHRGDVRDALDGSRWTVLGAGNEPPAFMPRDIWCYWAGTPNQHRQTKRLYRRMRIGPAQRELSRNNGERFLAYGCGCVPRSE